MTNERAWVRTPFILSKPTSIVRPTRISYAYRWPASLTSPLPQGQVHAPDRQSQAPAGASLFLYGLCNGWIGPRTTVVEASSGSTAVSEAYFARMLGLPFIAVMPRSTSAEKVAQIASYGGESHFVESAAAMYAESARLARELGGHYMDQFTYAERATDWRGNNNIAETIFAQMADEEHPVPAWIVVGAGTGGTSATVGRYIRYRRLRTRLCLSDPEASVFHRHMKDRSICTVSGASSLIEGIGPPRCEPSFVPELIDRAYAVSDSATSLPRVSFRVELAAHAEVRPARTCGRLRN